MRTVDRQHSVESINRLRNLILKSPTYGRSFGECDTFLNGLLFDNPDATTEVSMGYLELRLRSSDALIEAVERCSNEGAVNISHARFATFCFEDGYAKLDGPLPDLKRITGRIDHVCRAFSLSAIVLPDIEVVELQGTKQRLLSYHHHALVFRRDGSPIDPRVMTMEMNKAVAKFGFLDNPILISADWEGQAAIDRARRTLGYASKITSRVKSVWYDAVGVRHTAASSSRLTRENAVAVLRAWSLLNLFENVRGILQGGVIRTTWKRGLVGGDDLPRRGKPRRFYTGAQSARIWRKLFPTKVSAPNGELSVQDMLNAAADMAKVAKQKARTIRKPEFAPLPQKSELRDL